MSTLQERPVFNSLEPGLDIDLAPPVSPLAVLAMVLGFFSLTAAIAVSIVPFAIVVAVLCAALIWRLSVDTSIGGSRLAQIGLCCAVVGGAWGLTNSLLTKSYYYSHAAEHAKLFLETLSAGKQFEAFELTQPESSRLVTGTDIEAHYKGLMDANLPARMQMAVPEDMSQEMPSSATMKNSHAKEELEAFLANTSTKEVMSHGKEAKWEFVRGADVGRMSGDTYRIAVVMVDTTQPNKKYQVSLDRAVGQFIKQPGKPTIAIWDIDRVKEVKE